MATLHADAVAAADHGMVRIPALNAQADDLDVGDVHQRSRSTPPRFCRSDLAVLIRRRENTGTRRFLARTVIQAPGVPDLVMKPAPKGRPAG